MSAKVTCNAKFTWQLVFSDKNPNKDQVITHTYESTLTRRTSTSSAHDEIHNAAKSKTETASFGLNFDISAFEIGSVGASTSYATETTYNVSDEIKKSISTTTESTIKTKTTASWPVGPGEELTVYRLLFTAPGIYAELDVFITDPPPAGKKKEDITFPIDYFLTEREYVETFEVVYGNQASQIPTNVVQEVSYQDADINKGYGGNYVWLKAVWTKDVTKAATGFTVVKQGDPNPAYQDLARGAGGSYRYLIPLIQPNFAKRVVEVKLIRSSNPIYDFPGFDGHTTDINVGRKGDYLYLGWKLADVYLN